MQKIRFLIIILLSFSNIAFSQLPYFFTNTSHFLTGSSANSVAIGIDSTVFLANGKDGLRAYNYDGTLFTNLAHIDDISEDWYATARSVAISSDGTVFLATGSDGLMAYRFDGNSLINTAHIDEGGYSYEVAVGSDGTIFLANGNDGLRAYTYDGTSFDNTAHLNDGRSCYAVTVAIDGTVYISSSFGLCTYSYNESSFTNIACISDDPIVIWDIVIESDRTIFVASGDIPPDVEGENGLWAYHFDGSSFTNVAHINDGGWNSAFGASIGTDKTVFLASGYDGLRAYSFDGYYFTNTAHIDDGGDARGVAVGSDGTVFLANGNDGLRAYTYSSYLGVNDYNPAKPKDYTLLQNYPNPFNPITIISYSIPTESEIILKVFDVLGKEIKTLVNEQQPPGNYKIEFNASSLTSGVYLYQLKSGDFIETKKLILIR